MKIKMLLKWNMLGCNNNKTSLERVFFIKEEVFFLLFFYENIIIIIFIIIDRMEFNSLRN